MRVSATPVLRSGLIAVLLACFVPPLSGTQSQRSEEAENYYRKWLEQDVIYIISDEERAVFQSLNTPDERDQFIEQFWLRRDSDPTTAHNEFKEEHYRRIAYANDHFHTGVEGWRTDRGMIYIRWGPPTGIEKHPEGGSYQRKISEGGGITYTYPFEVWFYNHLEEIGAGIEIEFVDASRTNEYRIATDSDQKDALFWVPGAGATLGEQFGTMTRLDRIRTRYLGDPESGEAGVDTAFYQRSYRDYPMQRLETLFKLQSSASVKYRDLERMVTTKVSYDRLPVRIQVNALRMNDTHSVVPVTVFIENREISFDPMENNPEVFTALVGVYGQVSSLTGQLVYSFEEDIERRFNGDQLASARAGVSMFQKQFPLKPGRYKLSVVVQDQGSGKVGTVDQLLLVPGFESSQLVSSEAVLSRSISLPDGAEAIGEPFVIGKYRVVPEEDNRFRVQDQFAQAYFEVYNLQIDQTSLQPAAGVEIALFRAGEEIFPFTAIDQEFEFDRDRLLVYKTIPFQGLSDGEYLLRFRVTDRISGQALDKDVEFVVQ